MTNLHPQKKDMDLLIVILPDNHDSFKALDKIQFLSLTDRRVKKQMLLDVLNFDLPMGSDDWILKSFGKKVRNWRARVKKDYYDPSLSYREQINIKPQRVRPVQWKKLVKTWNKENSKIF